MGFDTETHLRHRFTALMLAAVFMSGVGPGATAAEDPESLCLFPPDQQPPTGIRSVKRDLDDHYRIVIRYLVVRRSDGTGGIDESLIDPFMRDLNVGFRDTPFVFVKLPQVDYIDNDDLYENIGTWGVASSLLRLHHQPGVVNQILTPTLFGGPPVTGLNFPNNPRGNLLAYERIGQPHSIVFPPHELGHIFWLYHPYEDQFGLECTDGSNCANAGDLVCDTPASPAVHSGNTTATGVFFAEIPGPCFNDPHYAPLTDLYMEAGWPAGHILRDRFTDGQVERMLDSLFNDSSDLIGPDRPEFLVDCDENGIDDIDEILNGDKVDRSRDMVPDVCQVLPRAGDLLVSGMTGDPGNRVRYFDRDGTFRETMWNGLTWAHQLRQGPDGLVYLTRLTSVHRLDLATGRTLDNVADGVLDGAGLFVDLLFADDGDLLVLDNNTVTIRRYAASGGAFEGIFANLQHSGMNSPKFMERGPDGHIYVVGNGAAGRGVKVIDGATGTPMGTFADGSAHGLVAAQGLVFHDDGYLYVSNGGGVNSVLRFDSDTGEFDRVFVAPNAGGLDNPHSLRFGPDGHLYVASRGDHTVKRYHGETGQPLGDFVAPATDGLDQPTGLFFVGAPAPRRAGSRLGGG